MKKYKFMYFILVLLFIWQGITLADDREGSIDFMIALDISNSMKDKLEIVKDYVNNDIIGELVRPGDYLLVIYFYGYTDEAVSFEIESEADILKAQQIVAQIIDTKDYTDIGNALDILKLHADAQVGSGRDKSLILITDGEQYSRPESKYYSTDGTINHELLKNAKTIAKEGWKIEIITFGTLETTTTITEQLGGTQTELPEDVTGKDLEGVELERGRIKAEYPSEKIIIGPGRKGEIALTLTSQDYKEEKQVTISDILLTIAPYSEKSVSEKTINFSIAPESTLELEVPIKLPEDIKAGDYSAEVVFKFAGQIQFLPARQDLSLHINSFLENNIWIIPVAIVLLIIIIIILILLIRKMVKGRQITFKLIVEENPLKKDTFKIRRGQRLYLQETFDMLNIAPKKSRISMAELLGTKQGIQLTVLKEDQIPSIKKSKPNVLREKLIVYTESGRELHIQFAKA